MAINENKKPQSIFPDLPRESPVITKDGDFSGIWSLGFASLFQALQRNYKNEGIIFPNLDADSILIIQNLYTSYIGGTYKALTLALPDISGQTVFDMTNRVSKQFVIATNTFPPTTASTVILAEWVPLAVMLNGSGTPVGNQAGLVGWQYFDAVGKVLYVCNTAGSASSAQWTAV